MPASRRARAMIFAPRSWPSRPGLATTTRILRPEPLAPLVVSSAEASMGGGSLEDRCLGVGPEDLLQSGDDLALGCVHSRAVEQWLQQVAVAHGGVLQHRQRGLHLDAPAPCAHAVEAVDLLALERGVDAKDLELVLVGVLIAIHADQDPLARVDLLLVVERGVRDLALRVVLL